MDANDLLDDVGSFALSKVIDHDLKRKGEYRDDVRNKICSTAGSALLGSIGTAIGGPVLGIATAALGHCIGQSAEFDGNSGHSPRRSSKATASDPAPNIDYDNLPEPLFDYDDL